MTLTNEQRREVNRTNSRKSTGPRTEAGKSKSKLNGLKHGLRAATLVLPGEDPEALEHRRDAWTEELDPRTDLERYFVRSAVEASWRLDRARRAETAAVARRVTGAGAKADRKDAHEVEHNSQPKPGDPSPANAPPWRRWRPPVVSCPHAPSHPRPQGLPVPDRPAQHACDYPAWQGRKAMVV